MMAEFHIVAANLIDNEGEYLFVKEGKKEVRGLWNLPAGGVNPDEEIKAAARREAKEETGLEVDIQGLIGVFRDESDRGDATVIIFVFHSRPQSYDVETPEGGEILEADFFSRDKFQDIDVRIPFLEESVRRYENGEVLETEVIQDFRGEV